MINRNIHIWLSSYIIQRIRSIPKIPQGGPFHIIFTIADHFEPLWNRPSVEQEIYRLNAWVKGYPDTVKGHIDADGKCPQHTWFYPYDEFRAWHIEQLVELCNQGYGEIELHLHHNNDNAESLCAKIEEAKSIFSKYGALVNNSTNENLPKHTYGFIHGNWSLDNSRRDGRWCGVNNELQVLAKTGCYADFTMPSAPSETQSAKINSIYYATDDPNRPKSYNTGVDVEVGRKPSGDLMIIQGPLCLNWKRRKSFIFPKIENGQIAWHNPPTLDRINLWIKQHIHVKGRPEWVLVKVYTHGAQDKNCESFFGSNGIINMLYNNLEHNYNDGIKYKLHYVTAREMYNIIKAAESGEGGDPNDYRDYIICRK